MGNMVERKAPVVGMLAVGLLTAASASAQGSSLAESVAVAVAGAVAVAESESEAVMVTGAGIERLPSAPADEVAPKDARQVRRGRLLLASGIPALALGLAGVAYATAAKCDDPTPGMRGTLIGGSVLSGVGLGLSTAGFAALFRAPRSARREPKSRKARGQIAGAAIGAVLAGSFVLVYGMAENALCNSD
jgi:MFS family permease